jgi:hypothetical protein
MKNGTDANTFADAELRAGGFPDAGADSRAETCAVLRAVVRADHGAETCAVIYAERKLRKRSVRRNRRSNKVVSQKAYELSILYQHSTDLVR